VLERISRDSRTSAQDARGGLHPGGGAAMDERDILRPHREPEVRRVDLASAVLDIIGWGGDPKTFEWFERPPEERLQAAIRFSRSLAISMSSADFRCTRARARAHRSAWRDEPSRSARIS